MPPNTGRARKDHLWRGTKWSYTNSRSEKYYFELHKQEAIMSKNDMPHEGHEKHLCYLHGEGLLKDNMGEWKKLVSNGQHVCGGCGRVANSSENLCDPQKL